MIVPQPAFAVCVGLNAVLLAVLGIQVLKVEPDLKRQVESVSHPQFYPSFLAHGPARAGEKISEIHAGSQFFIVHFAKREQNHQEYSYEIMNETGEREDTGLLSAPITSDPELYLRVPTSPLKPGLHTLIVHAQKTNDVIAGFRFEIQR
jgi:hypothetical protein